MKTTTRLLTIILAVALLATGCTRKESARRILEQNGYTNIEITGWRPFMAGQDDRFSTGFKAISPSGSPVSGAVTGAILKGSTIRLD